MEKINKEFECGICLQVCVEAVETSCCSNLFCEKCVSGMRECPICRMKDFKVDPSKLARRVISRLPVQCQHCEEEVERGSLGRHKLDCVALEHKCIVANCGYAALKDAFLEHAWAAHKSHLIECFSTSVDENKSKCSASPAVSIESSAIQKLPFEFVKKNGITNSAGRNAFLNCKNLKFYCRGPLNKCGCNDPLPYDGCGANRCGPAGGCNCRECMELDIKLRMLQKGQFLNECGKVSQKHYSYGSLRFTCGASCNANNQCKSCESLDNQTGPEGLYANMDE